MSPRLVFAGGGTGGHVFPMIAVADAVRRLKSDVELVFIGTARGIETRVVPERGYALELVDVAPIRGGGARGAIRGITRAARSIPDARALLRRLTPQAIFSAGGYAAGPVTIAARTLGIPVALMEPNSAIGLSNKLAAPFVQRAYTAFPESDAHFRRGSVLRTGVAIREGFRPQEYSRPNGRLRVLVVGGSQGAQSLNDAVPRALARASTPISVTHQAGSGRDEIVRSLYRELGAGDWAKVVSFIGDVAAALREADLVIGRAGASAVAEFCAVGRPSLLVPYPFAGDHQRFNAISLERHGAAVCVPAAEATEERLAEELDRLARDPETLPRMAASARSLGRPDAAAAIARDLLDLAGGAR
jgi:UDP-N-acetylglucosamine--N-acetylmuramyl-(pentapeptide) pyrophosphoryl-undecaprenol N-acetylglucosamine transferase